jgi:hypothetical protein
MNFFNWIREGVRQAVLLGVSEAVESIGPAPNGEDMSKRMLEVLRRGGPQLEGNQLPLTASNKRKKLGRSLNEIQASLEKS